MALEARERWAPRLFGARVSIHWTFLALVVWTFASSFRGGGSLSLALDATAFILAIFACVFLHELGHVLAARAYGIRTRSITLTFMGGLAALERTPRRAWHEFAISISGPAVNVALGAVIFGGAFAWLAASSPTPPGSDPPAWVRFGFKLAVANAVLAVLNLLPAFPLDGGRMCRAALAVPLGRERATNLVATLGLVFAAGFVVAAFTIDLLFLLLAFMVFAASRAERERAIAEGRLAGLTAGDALDPSAVALHGDAPILPEGGSILLDPWQGDFALVGPGEDAAPRPFLGIVRRDDLIAAVERERRAPSGSRARALASPDAPSLAPDLPLLEALDAMTRARAASAAVVADGRLLGLMTRESAAAALARRSG